MDYQGGLDDPSATCLDDSEDLNHSVLLVGYGTDEVVKLTPTQYFVLKCGAASSRNLTCLSQLIILRCFDN